MMCEIEKNLHKYQKLSQSFLERLETMVLNNKILLQDIPRSIRLEDDALYVYAFRLSSRSYFPCSRFVNDLNTICEDIMSLEDNSSGMLDFLVNRLVGYMSINEHEEDESFIGFKNNLDERIRSLIRQSGCLYGKQL